MHIMAGNGQIGLRSKEMTYLKKPRIHGSGMGHGRQGLKKKLRMFEIIVVCSTCRGLADLTSRVQALHSICLDLLLEVCPRSVG